MGKLGIILRRLQKAQDKGVKEIELLHDWETKGNARVIKCRLNKVLEDKEAVIIRRGVWYLSEHYWSMSKAEFKDTVWRFTIRRMVVSNNITLAILSIVFLIAYFFSVFRLEVTY